MEYEVVLNITVDPLANFLEVDDIESSRVVLQVIQDMLYDMDDIAVERCEVTRND
tara:strand:+ start:389 stop:553 length:165 start_codon:yes stop_codon:yes gene_type:complete